MSRYPDDSTVTLRLHIIGAVLAATGLSGCAAGIGIGIPIFPGVSVGVGVGSGGVTAGVGAGVGPVGVGVGVNHRGQVGAGAGVGVGIPVGRASVGVGVGTGTVLYDPQGRPRQPSGHQPLMGQQVPQQAGPATPDSTSGVASP